MNNKKNYQNGKIYQITSYSGDKIYIGSTTKQYLSSRMDSHRSHYKRWKNGTCGKIMVYDMFDEYGVGNCKILLLELYPCNSNDELIAREGYFIRTIECVNKVTPGRTLKEYREDNKDKISEKAKQYREDNKDKISEKAKQYREDNKEKYKKYREVKMICDCGSNICQGALSKHNHSTKHLTFMNTQLINPM